MRRVLFFIAIFLFTLSSVMGQMIPINLPADGNWPTIVGDSIMIIGPRQNELTEEQRYFNPIYLMVYPGKEHLKAQMIRAGLCDCDPTKPNRRIGVFSVAPDKKVSFSQGNLQYLPAINLWKFANTQYEYLGNANKYLKPTFRNWVDLFGWSANNTTAPFGVSTSTNVADYAGDFVDWGTNTICGDAPGTWRTLSADEWKYLFEQRKNALQLRSKGSINGHRGHILLPDDWVLPEGMQFVAEPDNLTMELDINTYTPSEWSIMEEAGAVFLPAAGRRDGTTVGYLVEYSGVWSSTSTTNTNAFHTYYNYDSQIIEHHWTSATSRINGRSVRLVHDTIVPRTIPDPCLVVKVNDTLSINMMCVEGGTFMMGAMEGDTQVYDNEKPAHEVTLTYNYYIAQTEVTQALWKAVMGNNPSTMIGDDLPVNNVLWEEADAFVKRLSQMTGYTFHLPTEAEWEFAARGGKKSKGYLYAGSDDVNEVAWYANNSGGKTHAVGTKKPNELGIYDMSGNAWEWCSDWLAPYSAETQVNPIGPATGEYHVYHGGGWNHGQRYARSSHRRTTTEGYVKSALGLRVAIREKIEPEAVDLGLSVKWANFNIGAFDPTHYGDYFAWGETEPKETYSWATYKWCDGTSSNITKYNSADGKTVLDLDDDAAYVNWGDKWRMPTKEECQELLDKCTWSESIQNGVKGYVVTSKHTGNSIFFPHSGYFNHDNSATLQGEKTLFYTWSSEHSDNTRAYDINNRSGAILLEQNTRRCGFPIRPVYDDRVTLTVIPTPEDAKVSFHCSGYQWAGNSITVDKGKDVLYQVTNVDAGYLSQGDSIYKLTKDSVLYVTLRPFSDGNWVKVDNSEYTKQEGYYVSRNKGAFASYSVWNYYVLPVLPGETYRVRSIAGQHAALWMAASTAPNPATNTRPTKISCCANRGVAAYVADEVTIPDGAKYLIINSRNGKEMMVERKVPEPCMVVKVNDTLSINMMCVEGGTFMMGATENDTDAENDEYPQHQVTISDFMIGQTEVTQELWTAVMGTNPSKNQGNYLPVEQVTWDECQEFVAKLNQLTGKHFRLPTEAEWEFAARGGNKSKGYKYSGSDNLSDVAWYDGNSGNKTHKVGTKQPNELGIFDMSGNVYEKCQDWYAPYTAEAQVNPQGPAEPQTHRVVRGGCSGSQATNNSERVCRVINRGYARTTSRESITGLRLVLDTAALTPPEPEYVDLGLSVKWATFNVGATSPNEIGNFYAWGEIEPKDTYTVNNYKWWNKTSKETTKYCTIDSLAYGGVADGLTELQPQDDIAHILKGEHWRMPDLDECKELVNGCTWTVSTRQGQIGFEGISKINGNTIFLPVVGFRAGANLVHETLGGYWSSTLNIEKQSCAMGLYLNRETPSVGIYYNSSRQNGFLIRPVYDEVPDPCLVVKVNDTLSINLMCVEGGTFMMGSDAPDAQADEQPVHEVTLSDYYIGQTEVTQHLWKSVMGSDNNPSATKGNNLPVTNITWDEAQQFVERLSELTGIRFRLPTEAEWEYAARGGQRSKGYTYAGSNDIDGVGWYNGNSSNKTHAVGQKQPNELGIYDMTGNVWEYCSDWHMPYSAQAQTNPTGAVTGEKHVLRGGCYHYDSKNCTNTNRHSYYTPDKGGASTGLRIVLEP